MKRREVITIVAAVVVIGLLYAALKLSAGGNSKSANRSPIPSNKSEGSATSAVKAQPAQRPGVKPPSKGPGDTPNFLSDSDVEGFAKDAMDNNRGCPADDFTEWSKTVDQGELVELMLWKNGEPDSNAVLWHETGKIQDMSLFKEGEMVSHQAYYPTGEKKGA